MRRPILFLHIPRTGGKSLKDMCLETFGASQTLTDAHLFDVFDAENAPDLLKYDVVEGHVSPRYFKRTALRAVWPQNGFTILREPVARTISQAIHTRMRASHARGDQWKKFLSAEIHDPDDLFEKMPLLANGQAKLLAARFPHARVLDDESLADAKATLDRIVFGLTEQFTASIAVFSEQFDVAFPRLVRTNVSPTVGNEDLRSDEFRAAVRRHNDLDIALYEHALECFGRRLDARRAALFERATESASLEMWLVAPESGDGAAFVPVGTRSLALEGWLLIDGRPADAALVRAGDEWTPIGCRFASLRMAENAKKVDNRFAGIRGTVPLTDAVTSIEIVAFDTARGLRAETRLELVRDESSARVKVGRAAAADPEVEADEDRSLVEALPPPYLDEEHGGRDRLRSRGTLTLELLKGLGLEPASHLLEIGCGEGWLAYVLAVFLDGRGAYAGCDVASKRITWLNDNYAASLPNFRFDLMRPLQPASRRAKRERLPYDDDAFDLVCAFGSFTRLSLVELRRELAEAARVARQGGTGVFMINGLSERDERPPRISGREYVAAGDGVYNGLPDERGKDALVFDDDVLARVLRDEGWTLVKRLAGSWHYPDQRATAPFHGADVCVCTPALQKVPRLNG